MPRASCCLPICLSVVLSTEPEALRILDKHFTTKFYFLPILFCLFCCAFIEHLLLARPST